MSQRQGQRHNDKVFTQTSLTIDRQALQAELDTAIQFEIKHAYTNVQGRRSVFNQFVIHQLRQLLNEFDDDVDLLKLMEKFQRYPLMDMGQRMQTLQSLQLWFLAVNRPQEATSTPALAQATQPENAGDTPVQGVRGVGPHIAKLLLLLGIQTVRDLVYYFPRTYLDYQQQRKISELAANEDVTVLASVKSVSVFELPRKPLLVMTLVVSDRTGLLAATWFYGKAQRAMLEGLKNKYAKGTEVMLSGRTKWDAYRSQLTMDRPQVEILSYGQDEGESLQAGRIVPVYPLTQGLNLKSLRRSVNHALERYVPTVSDPVPLIIIQHYDLNPLPESLWQIHFPDAMAQAQLARKRLVFDELFCIQVKLAQLRAEFKQNLVSHPLARVSELNYLERGRDALPFQLTNGQQQVLNEILTDMSGSEPMFRLLQGDVGSGKTVVALLAMLRAIENGYQAALMAPTEILAEQHYQNFIRWLTPLGLRAGLFVGKAPAKQKREVRQALANGNIHVAVGTHALIQESVEFSDLGLVVIDEQHRFGVRQRTLLRSKGDQPHLLSMTATPIPRTLAMTLYGDLDVSILRERPPGRSPIITALVTPRDRKSVYARIREQIVMGRQVYVVFPLIEESESLSAKAATTECERLQTEIFPEFTIGLLHGRMPPEEKDAIMHRFAGNNLQILVSTTVIEVGVDVPNATVMWIESSERFGLSQLHQLRGRVGRGAYQSYCYLALDNHQPDVMERLDILVQTEDGFEIAEQDLALRGPGEFLGTRQSGLPDLLLADLVKDQAILEQAREAARSLAETEGFSDTLLAYVRQKTGSRMDVLGAG